MNLTLNMDKRLEAVIAESKCVNCDSCSHTCPVGAIGEGERPVEGLILSDNAPMSSDGCPLGIVPQVLTSYIKAGRIREAAEYLYSKNPMAATCAAVCDQYCQRADRRSMLLGAPVNVRALERYIIDKHEAKPCSYKIKYDEKIAIIGGGPAGIAAANGLASKGYRVTIIEADETLGGSMAWGIPGFRLDKDMMDADIARVITDDIEVRTGVKVGIDVTLEELSDQFDAVIVATGASKGAILNFEGTDGDMVLDGVSVLRTINLEPENEFTAVGEKVVVIGGGRFAVDVSRTIARKGKEVTCVALEDLDTLNVPEDYINAMVAEGINFHPQTAPKRINRNNGQVVSMDLGKVTYRTNEEGKEVPTIAAGDEFQISCDTVVFAVGRRFDASQIGTFESYPDGVIKTDKIGRTSLPKVFACGDITGFSNSVVGAMLSGRKTADNVDAVLRGRMFPKRTAEFDADADSREIRKEDIAMVRAQHEQRFFSRSSKMDIVPAEDIVSIMRGAGVEEDMPKLIDTEAEDYASKKKVAVIGGGVAGITAAISLAKNGYAPTIFEKTPCLGGRYRWFATDKRVDADKLEEELENFMKSGIPVVLNASGGIKPSISELKADGYEAILFAVGESMGVRPDLPKVYAKGVFEMVSLASRLSRELEINSLGEKAIVTGSDEMAVDVARKLKVFTKDVTLICPCSRGQLQAKTAAIMDALEEGVNLVTGTEFSGATEELGKVTGVDIYIRERDITINIPCDTLVIGDTQKADTATIIARDPALKGDEKGTLITDNALQTPIKGVLAIGGLDMGSVAAGIMGAVAVENFFNGGDFNVEDTMNEREIPETPDHEILEGRTIADKGFEVGTRLLSTKQARQEASRYIPVGFHRIDGARCIGCGLCSEVCPEGAIELMPCKEVE
ncbi:MAG: FAD-dependent oxidoreductase [Eubacterium sp.]|nr:FAD-dependent oxidoreductase [Candidatus Colimonas fimequi]